MKQNNRSKIGEIQWSIVLIFTALFIIIPVIYCCAGLPIQQVKPYTGQIEVAGWVMSEKLDGIRGYWDGRKMLTRSGNTLHLPPWYIGQLPTFPLDGELWRKRNDFQFVQKTVLDRIPSENWKEITYNVFEVPTAEGNFLERLDKVSRWLEQHPNSPVRIIKQIPCRGAEHVQAFLHEVETQEGEGVIVKDPSIPFSTGNNQLVLKIKSYQSMEGEVIGQNPGKGKFEEMMGSLTVRLTNGLEFNLGSGFNISERKTPPPLGSIVVFKYHGKTENGVPRFASYLRIRKD